MFSDDIAKRSQRKNLVTARIASGLCSLVLAPLLAVPALAQELQQGVHSESDGYVASIRRGPYGVAHIKADNYGSLGYGEAYAAAEDHVCNIAYELMRARGESARFLGAGDKDANIASDAVIRALDVAGQSKRAFAQQSPDIQEWLVGYSAGFNRYLEEHQGGRNDSWCSSAPWLTKTTAGDFTARMVVLALTIPRISGAVAAAQPPADEALAAVAAPDTSALDGAALVGMGSNGWALGAERTENGRGMLLANPHYPWYGGSRFWEKHLTIPGEMDVYGAGLLGSPGVTIGFNSHLGWTHTVSASQRIVLYQLTLDPENPLRYRHGDAWKTIEQRTVEVPVKGAEGAVESRKHSIYFSEHGPLLVMPNMSWSKTTAFAVRDANSGNYDLLAQWTAMGLATDMDAFIDAHRRYNAMPWVNTIASSADGRAVYLDNSTVGNLSEEAQQGWRDSLEQNPLAAGLYAGRRMILLDGSVPANDWLDDPSATLAGTVPFKQRPLLERDDYVFNSNDSYWLTNPAEPLSGHSILYGPTETARTLRTRMNVRLLNNRYGDAGEDGRFNVREIQSALFANRGFTFELLGTELVALCREQGEELDAACRVLEAYDGSLNLDSAGAVLFREWITRYERADTVASDTLFRAAFTADAPVTTPAGLGDSKLAVEALQGAVAVLEEAGLPLAASLREAQFAWRAGEAIAVHGGNTYEGVANLQMAGNPAASPVAGVSPTSVGDSRYLTDSGYPVVHGSSFMLTLAFDDRGPIAEALLSYSQSGNPNAPHFSDQTRLYAEKKWRQVAFHAADVKRATRSIRVLRSAPAQ